MSVPTRWPKASVQYWLLVAFIIAMTAFTMCSAVFFSGKGYWDNIRFFGIFRNQLHSLNTFGEFAWWFPYNQNGWPGYYYSILGDINAGAPLFAICGFIVFLFGKLGINFQTYFDFYVLYHGAITPALFILAGHYAIRPFFSSLTVRLFAIVLLAFSPGVIFNQSDIGFLEPLIYYFFFVGSLVRFMKDSNKRGFAALVLSICIIGISFTYSALFFNALFVPFTILIFCVFTKRGRIKALKAFRSQPLLLWLAGVSLAALCMLPNLIVLSQSGDLVRSTLGEKYYNPIELKQGNPLEALMVSIPYLGFEWTKGAWIPRPASEHISYAYMGFLCFPLFLFGLMSGQRRYRYLMIVSVVFVYGILNLASLSPLFVALAAFPTPLRGNSHFSDALFRSGGFLLIWFGAVYGLNWLRKTENFKRFIILFGLSTAITFIVLDAFGNLYTDPIAGLTWLLTLVTFALLLNSKSTKLRKATIASLVAITFIDVSSEAFSYLRGELNNKGLKYTEEALPDGLGLTAALFNHYANVIVSTKAFLEFQNLKISTDSIPTALLFDRVHANDDIKSEFTSITDYRSYVDLQIEREALNWPDFTRFANRAASPTPPPGGNLKFIRMNYNNVVFEVDVNSEAVLFLRDTYSPYWKVTVNGEQKRVAKALFNSKAFVIPQGHSLVEMQFHPPWVSPSFAAAYTILLCALAYWLRAMYRRA